MSSRVETTSPPVAWKRVIDLGALLAPISDDAPVGEYLRPQGFYVQLDDARSAEDNLPRGEWQRKLKRADWPRVITLATGALTKRTKDLQIAVWLVEALVNVHGFAGLRDGLSLVRELHERYWDDMYPSVEDGELNTRANRISWLSMQLSISVKEVPLTKGFRGEGYGYFDWKRATEPRPADDEDEDEDEDGDMGPDDGVVPITAEQWRLAASTTSHEFYARTLELIDASGGELSALDRVLDEKFVEERNGTMVKNSPGLKDLKTSLGEVGELVTQLSRKKRPQKSKKGAGAAGKQATPPAVGQEAGAEEPAASEQTPENAPGDAAGGAWDEDENRGVAAGPVRTREEALMRLGEVADYFRGAEPHSPVSYLVERAIKWGRMPLEAWLEDVLGEDPVLGKLRETLGLKGGAPEPDEDAADDTDDEGEE